MFGHEIGIAEVVIGVGRRPQDCDLLARLTRKCGRCDNHCCVSHIPVSPVYLFVSKLNIFIRDVNSF